MILQNIRDPNVAAGAQTRATRLAPFVAQSFWLKIATGALFSGVTLAFAFYVGFSRKVSPDEGYLMITVRGFLEGNPLYDKLFTQYGPFYYFYEWFVHAVLQVPLTHDATRWLCMVHWISAAAILAFASARLSRSTFVGLFVFAQSVVHLAALAKEPGHPQEIVVLLLAVAFACATCNDSLIGRCGLIAAVTAAIAFTKINVGAFLGMALFLTLRCFAADRLARWSNGFIALFCAVLPFVLTRAHLDVHGCMIFAVVTAAAILVTFLTASSFAPKSEIPLSQHVRIAIFFVVPAMLILATALLTGSSVRGLLDGLLLTPLAMPGSVLLALPLRDLVVVNAFVSLAVAALVVWRSKNGGVRRFVLALKFCYGAIGAFLFIGGPIAQFAYLLPWSWLVLVPGGNDEEPGSSATFPRVFLCLAGAWIPLQAYPIAGTQVSDGTCLLVVSYALCLADTYRALRLHEAFAKIIGTLSPATHRLVSALPAIALLYVFANIWCELPSLRRGYAALVPLDLAGSRLIRVTPESRDFFHEMTAYLESESDSFVTLPSMNSLYFWTSKRPPTQLNGTGWYQFDHRQQTEILTALWRSNRPRLLLPADFKEHLSIYWYKPQQIAPLLDFLAHDCEEVHRIGPMVVYGPKSAARLSKAH